MSAHPKVSVVIPTYNRPDKVVPALQSVLAQTYRDYEVWIVDDGSKDGAGEAVRPFLSDRVHYVFQENGGPSKARNTGLRLSKGEYLAFLDDDDVCLPERLEEQVQFLDEHPEVGILFTDLWKVTPDGQRFRFTETVLRFSAMFRANGQNGCYIVPAKEMLRSLLVELPLKPSTLMMRRRCFEAAGEFNEVLGLSEWIELILRMARCGEVFGYLDKPLVNYSVWHGNIGAGSRGGAPRLSIGILKENRRLANLDPVEDRWARCGIAVQYYKLGNILLQDGHRVPSCRAFLAAFGNDSNPLYLGLALSCLLPHSIGRAGRWIRRRLFGSLLRKPWETEATRQV